jgi:hypothetical protein
LLTGHRYTDLGPLRAVRWSTLKDLDMADRTWGWTVEMQAKAALRDVPTLEVDVPYRSRTRGKSKVAGDLRIALAAGIRIPSTILTLWWKHRRS